MPEAVEADPILSKSFPRLPSWFRQDLPDMARIGPFVIALVFAALAVIAVKQGRVTYRVRGPMRWITGRGYTFRRSESPFVFWLAVSAYLVIALLCVWTGIRSW